jgi:outer membrane protein OmpA-like peptidoglycan-associated protein
MGSEDSNQTLSERRADSVKRYLVGRGVQPERLSSSGRGENAPVADNDSPAGRQQNRRVEVVISQVESGQMKTTSK